MSWILIALIAPLLHGLANVLDNYFTNKIFKDTSSIIFYVGFINFIFLPIVFLIQMPDFHLPISYIPLFIILGITNVFYLFPYYKALQNADTSVVTSLFDLGRIFIPILAFIFVRERLGFHQYIGFLVIILSSTLMSINGKDKFKINKSFWYMLLCSLILTIEIIIYKYILTDLSWGTTIFWSSASSFIIGMSFFLIPIYRRKIFDQFQSFKKNIKILFFGEFLTWGGIVSSLYVISFIPVTLEESVSSFQPFFVLFYGIILSRFFPNLIKEKIDPKSIFKKIILFVMMILGIIMTLHQ